MKEYFIEKENKRLDNSPIYAQLQSTDKKKQIIRPHIHSAIEILIVKSGAYYVYVGERKYKAQPGDMVLLRSNTIHHTYSISESGSSYYVIMVRPSLIAELSDGNNDSKLLLFFALDREQLKCFWTKAEMENTPLGHAVKHFTEEFDEKIFARTIALTIAISGIMLEILREGNKTNDGTPTVTDENTTRRIYDTLLFINKNYKQPITAYECAVYAGMSYSYFSRTFRAVIGKTFKEYLNFTRINHAQKALMSTDMTVTEIAANCGYDNVSYFISVYKRIKGTTPYTNKKK